MIRIRIHYILSLFILLAASTAAWAQQTPAEAEYPYRRDIEKGRFDKALEKIQRHLQKDPSSLECHYAAYQFYSCPGNPAIQLDSAYRHLSLVRRLYDRADTKQIERLARDSYSSALIDYGFNRLGSLGLADARMKRTPDAFNHFISTFTLVPQVWRDSAILHRDTLEFQHAKAAGTVAMLQDFVDRRKESSLVIPATRMRDSLLFLDADAKHSTVAYQLFCQGYPRSHLYARAQDSIYMIDYRDTRRHDAEQYYRTYATRYPQSPYAQDAEWYADSMEYHREVDTSSYNSLVNYLDSRNRPSWGDTALHHLAIYALRNSDIQAATAAVDRMMPSTRDYSLLSALLHDAYIYSSIRNYPAFYHRFPYMMDEAQQEKDSLAYLTNEQYSYPIIDSCIRSIAPAHEAYMMLQQLVKDDIDHGRYSAACAIVQNYGRYFESSKEYSQLLSTLQRPSKDAVKLTSLGPAVNTAKGDEYAPVISADDQTLYFAGKHRTDNIGGEDIFSAHRTKQGWSQSKIEMDLSHTYGNEAPVAASADGTSLLLYQSGILYQASLTEDGWKTVKLPASINRSSWQADAMLAANGRAILFAAQGKTVREVDSSLNLYVSFLDSTGRWGEPVELGSMINTPFDERSPFLHPDMQTLYFASEGHGSLGQMDMYVTHRLDDTWQHWSEPVNLGREVNTTDDDWGYKVSTDGKRAYLSRRDGSQNIYALTLPSNVRPNSVVTVSGTVATKDGTPVAGQICWENPTTGELEGICNIQPVNGKYYLLLPQGTDYNLYYNGEGYYPVSQHISSMADNQMSVNFTALPLSLDKGDTMMLTLTGINFAIASDKIDELSLAELNHLAEVIKKNGYHATLGVHLDGNVGDANNRELSQRRADSVKEYLVGAGVNRSSVRATGFGSDQPLTVSSKVSSKTARPQSRRIEVRLYK